MRLPGSPRVSSWSLFPERNEWGAELTFHARHPGKTSLVGTVAHECSLTPSIQSADASAAYARILRERQRKAAEPRRTLKMLDVDKAQANRMASGMGTAGLKGRVATFAVRFLPSFLLERRGVSLSLLLHVPSSLCLGELTRRMAGPAQNTTNKAKSATSSSGGGAGQPQRLTRIPKNELLDLLFPLFAQAPYWHLRALNDHVQQPQTYLRETLNEVAILVPKGPYAQMWALRPEYKGEGGAQKAAGAVAGAVAAAAQGSGAGPSHGQAGGSGAGVAGAAGAGGVKPEPDAGDAGLGEEGEEDDDDEDFDLEMVS